MRNFFYLLFGVKRDEVALFFASFFFIFILFSSYAILRPLRDAFGIEGGESELKWLFLGTFIACIIASLALMFVSSRLRRKFYTDFVLIFFISNLFIFYFFMMNLKPESSAFLWLCRIFYIWVSVFNLFAFSSAWSLMADVFSKEASARLFGIIAAGASLGSIVGASFTKFLAQHLAVNNLIFAAVLLLLFALALKYIIMRILASKEPDLSRFEAPINAKNPFIGFKLIIKSKYLLFLSLFIVLLTSVSTFLYLEQARIVRELFTTRAARIEAFAGIDLIVQSLSLFIQIFLTAKIVKLFGLNALLSVLGFVLGFCFIVLAFTHPAFLPLVVAMSVRRVGEYALVKPGREMLFVPLGADEKYKVKSFLDTVLYRAGDALSAQIEGLFASIGIAFVLLVGAFISFVWGFVGVFLAKSYKKEEFG